MAPVSRPIAQGPVRGEGDAVIHSSAHPIHPAPILFRSHNHSTLIAQPLPPAWVLSAPAIISNHFDRTTRIDAASPNPPAVPAHVPTEPVEIHPQGGVLDPQQAPGHLPQNGEAENDAPIEGVEPEVAEIQGASPPPHPLFGLPLGGIDDQ